MMLNLPKRPNEAQSSMEWIPDLRQIRAFVAVAEEGSFTLAARRIFVTQSAVSHALRTLEEQLSCQLLDRSGKRVTVTAEGEMLLKRCRRILSEIELAGRDVDSLRRWGQTRIRIGATHSLCNFLLPAVLREFRDCFPRCEPVIEAGDSNQLMDRLAEAELDVVLGLKSRGKHEEGHRFMFHDHLGFVVPPSHPWATDPSLVAGSLAEQQFIIYAKGTETNRLVKDWMDREIGRCRQPVVLGDMQAIREMAKLGIGVGIVAAWVAAREIEEGSLCHIPIPGEGIAREWGAFHSPKKNPSLVEEAFIGLCGMAFGMMES
jgi:LysR family transcriptional regulator, low CO2-responsive transcriptional regulator